MTNPKNRGPTVPTRPGLAARDEVVDDATRVGRPSRERAAEGRIERCPIGRRVHRPVCDGGSVAGALDGSAREELVQVDVHLPQAPPQRGAAQEAARA